MMLHPNIEYSTATAAGIIVEYDLEKLIECACQRIASRAEELTALDAAIGDADHGINMKRGCDAVLAQKHELSRMTLPAALHGIGTILLMEVGGASGPIYATVFLALAKNLDANSDLNEFSSALSAAVDAVKKRGRVELGQKTLLDVLSPISTELKTKKTTPEKMKAVATQSAISTVPMWAGRGRASYMGERSVGHLDPGARSCQIIIEAICDVLEGAA
jgi:phosphoenolpyruvate---glycerone phosphotransferase subunit DhaL